MSALNQILDRIAQSEAKADSEHAQVVEAVNGLKAEIAGLRDQLTGVDAVDPAVVTAALDRLDGKIDAIYTPDPPAEPAPVE